MSFVIQVSKDKKHVNIYEAAYTKQSKKETSKYMIQQKIDLADGQQITRKGIYCMDPIDKAAYFFAFIKSLKHNENPFEIFIGIDNTAQVFPRNASPNLYHGASILIRFKESNECWFIGIDISKFYIEENIVALYSPIGNSDVVYPYLITDSKCYVFECALHSIDKNTVANSDVYNHYWSNGSLWNRTEFTSRSVRQIDKKYYSDPTVAVNTL
jgi:hypothetical protein